MAKFKFKLTNQEFQSSKEEPQIVYKINFPFLPNKRNIEHYWNYIRDIFILCQRYVYSVLPSDFETLFIYR